MAQISCLTPVACFLPSMINAYLFIKLFFTFKVDGRTEDPVNTPLSLSERNTQFTLSTQLDS